jgi:hypothetical protein
MHLSLIKEVEAIQRSLMPNSAVRESIFPRENHLMTSSESIFPREYHMVTSSESTFPREYHMVTSSPVASGLQKPTPTYV